MSRVIQLVSGKSGIGTQYIWLKTPLCYAASYKIYLFMMFTVRIPRTHHSSNRMGSLLHPKNLALRTIDPGPEKKKTACAGASGKAPEAPLLRADWLQTMTDRGFGRPFSLMIDV